MYLRRNLVGIKIAKDWDISKEITGRYNGEGLPIIGATLQKGLNDIEPNGSFVACDLRISEVLQGVTHLKMNRGRMGELRFGDNGSSNKFLVKIKDKRLKGLSFQYLDADGGVMEANGGRPRSIFNNGIVIESTPLYNGVRMDIIANNPLNAPTEYTFSSKTYGQDYTVIEENDGLTFRGDNLEPIYIKAPFAEDANGDTGSVSIHYLGMENNLHIFKKVVDEAWLRQAVAPVRIDPDITIEDGVDGGVIEDNMMNTTQPTTNFGTFTLGFVSTDRSELLYADLSAFPDVTPLSGKFLCTTTLLSSALSFKAYKLLKRFVELESTPTIYKTGSNWETLMAKGATDRAATEEGTFSASGVGFVTDVDITIPTLTEWLTDNKGLLLEYVSGPTWGFGSAEHATTPIQFYFEYTEAAEGSPAYYYAQLQQ